MGIEWTDEALQAACIEYGYGPQNPDDQVEFMRAALDAAVKAQDHWPSNWPAILEIEKRNARAEAMEEAAKVADLHWSMRGGHLSTRIRALKHKPANQTDGGE